MNNETTIKESKSEITSINSNHKKEKLYIINQIQTQKQKISYQQDKTQTPSNGLKNRIAYHKKRSTNLITERSTQMSTESGVFNDKQIIESTERLGILKRLQEIKLKNVVMKSKTRSSNDLFKEYHQEHKILTSSYQVNINDKFLHCWQAINKQKHINLTEEIRLQENLSELNNLQEELQFVKDSIKEITNSNQTITKEQICKLQLNQIKEKHILSQLLNYIENLESLYYNHLDIFSDYLYQLKYKIKQIKIDEEYELNE